MNIDILERSDSLEEEYQCVDSFEIKEIDPLRVKPIHEKVGSFFAAQELAALIEQIQPLDEFNKEEPEMYYAFGVDAWVNGNIHSSASINIPHHIGVQLILESVLEKYGQQDDLFFQIS